MEPMCCYRYSSSWRYSLQNLFLACDPPQKNAKTWQHGNYKAPPHPRDENLRAIRKRGRKDWKRQSNYHQRSIAETTMSRLKAIFSGKLRSRKFDNQAAELLLQCTALNRMIQVAKPDTVWVDD